MSTMTREESKAAIEEFWGAFRDVTEDEVREAIGQIPDDIREKLAQGPHPRRWTCGVCQAFPATWYKNESPDRSDPMWIVFSYHESVKLQMTFANDQWYGEHANEVYRRCIATYRAAGWAGEAEEPNA